MTTYDFDARLLRSQGDAFEADEPVIVSWIPSGELDLAPTTAGIMARMTGTYTDVYVKAVDQFIRTMEGTGRWQTLDFFNFYQAQNEQDALLNWRSDAYSASNLGASFDPYLGFTTSDGGNVLDTGFNPNSGTYYAVDDAMFGFFAATDPSSSGKIDIGAKDGANSTEAYFSIDDALGRVNGLQDISATLTEKRGLYIIDRYGNGASDVSVYENNQDASATGAGALATTNVPNFNLYVGGVNNAGVVEDITPRLYGVAFSGATMSAAEYAVFHDALIQLIEATRLYPPPTITSFNPTSGDPSSQTLIEGTNFIGATSVQFGGTEAQSFTIESATELDVNLPNLADGFYTITVTTPGGTATSATDFEVTSGGFPA